MHSGITEGTRIQNGFARKTHMLSAEQVADGWTCKKRDGKTVPFDCKKIRTALFRCFNAVTVTPTMSASTVDDGVEAAEKLVDKIVKAVVNTVEAKHLKNPSVEDIQRFIIAQLWAEGLFDAAEHYQNYRETHRKARLAKPIPKAVADRVLADQKHFPSDLQYYQFMSKFSKWMPEERRRETWKETTYDRVIPWFKNVELAKDKLRPEEWQELADAMYNLEVSPAMRVVQMAGPALDRCNVGAYNCAYQPLSDIFAFPELLYILMQGTGEGFSCENEYVGEMPKIKKMKDVKPETLITEDSTEGWCNTYFEFLQRLWDGYDSHVDVTRVRKKGTILKTKGGRSSGPEPFLELIAFARNLIKAKQGRYLDDIDAHDLACMTGKIVQVGGVRRAAEISLSDLDSMTMRNAKAGNWYAHSVHRTMANNSAVYDFPGTVPVEVFMEEWLSLVKSKSGERGIFNRRAAQLYKPKRRKTAKWGCNPCAEIILRPYEFCNLSIAIARPWDTVESLKKKVRLATIFGKLQSLCTKFNYIRKDWKANCDEERLLGVDITGHADCPLLKFDTPDRTVLLKMLNKVVEETDIEFSKRFGVNRSAANTTVKPGGDSAVLFDCASGVSPRFSPHYMRWVRESQGSPVAKFLIESGVPYAPAPEAPEALFVFGFPKKSPEGATFRHNMTAKQQFFNWLDWKENWAEHSVSATIYVDDHEWPELGGLVYKHIDKITGLSFLPLDNGTYTYAPHEELSPEKYTEVAEKFPSLNWAKLGEYETEDMTESRQTMACVGDKC